MGVRRNSRGKAASRGRSGPVQGPPGTLPPGGDHSPRQQRHYHKQSVPPPGVMYEGSPQQIPQPPPLNPPPFMLPPPQRGMSQIARSQRPYEGHPGPMAQMYVHDGMPSYANKPPFSKHQDAGAGRLLTPYDLMHMQDARNIDQYKHMISQGHMRPMMMGQYVPMIPMNVAKSHKSASVPTTMPPRPAEQKYVAERSAPSVRKREARTSTSDEPAKRRAVKLEDLIDSSKVVSKADAICKMLSRLQEGLRRIKIAIPSIFRVRNNFKLRHEEEKMIAVVEEIYQFILAAHLQKENKIHFPLDMHKHLVENMTAKEELLRFVGSKNNLAVINVAELQAALASNPLHYNNGWFAVRWMNVVDEESFDESSKKTPYFVKMFSLNSLGTSEKIKHAILLRALTVDMFHEHLDVTLQLCNTGKSYREATLQAMGYYALWCDDDSFITLASSILSILDMGLQVQFYVEVAKFLDSSRYRLTNVYMERYFERILPMCLAAPDPRAWSPTIKLLMRSIEPLRLGIKSSNTAISLLRTLKSWCNVFISCEDTCVEVFNKCIQLVLQAGDDSRIVVRASAADLAVQIWLNSKGKEAILKRVGYDTVRTLGCISGVQAIKFNIWSDLLSTETTGGSVRRSPVSLPDNLLCRVDMPDTVLQYLQHEEGEFIISMLQADPTVLSYLMNWYLLRYCKITKTLLALEKIASVIRFSLMTYPRIFRSGSPHTPNNIAILCCWMLNIATSCSVGSGCLELANVKMALFVDWLFFNYQYNSRIIRLCISPDATTQCDVVLQRFPEYRRLFVKELAKCIYMVRMSDIADDEIHTRRLNVLLGPNEVMSILYSKDIDTFKMLLDYLLNAIMHYYSEVAVVAVDVISAIFIVSALDLTKSHYTLALLLTAIKTTMLGKMCSALDINLDSIAVQIEDAEGRKRKQTLQLKSALEPIGDIYTNVTAISEKHKNPCYDDTLKEIMLQCYAMVVEYLINLESLNAVYHPNHLTVDTIRANHELDRLNNMECPKLYPNGDIINSEEGIDSDDGDATASDKIESAYNENKDDLSDVSSDSDEYADIENAEESVSDSLESASGISSFSGVKDDETKGNSTVGDDGKQSKDIQNLPSYVIRKYIQTFIQVSMNNPSMDVSSDPLYAYLKESLKANETPNYTVFFKQSEDSKASFTLVYQNAAKDASGKEYRVASVIEMIISYLLETAMQCLHDEANGTASVDNVMFKDWIVHIFNTLVRLLVSLYMNGYVGIAWELMYYMAAVSTADIREYGVSDLDNPIHKRLLVTMTLFFNMIHSVSEKRMVSHNSVIQRVIVYVVKRSVSATDKDLDVILQKVMPIRFALETVFKNEYKHFGRFSSLMALIMNITPVSSISELLGNSHFTELNIFTNDLDDYWLMSFVGTMLTQGPKDPLHLRKTLISWQIACRMYEMAFCTEKMKPALNQNRSFLRIQSEQDVPRKISRLPYVTGNEIGEGLYENEVLCFLGRSNTKRANFMAYQKGYTFSDGQFSNEKAHILSRAMVGSFRTKEVNSIQVALFSLYPILVHSVPTKQIMHDVVESLDLVLPRKSNYYNPPMQFISEMLLAILVHWLSRYPQFLETVDYSRLHVGEALDQLAVKYAVGHNMQFAFNGTMIKVQLENCLLLKYSM
ncbi:hypothetical protein BgAZ_102710 [Babesia gibsoni]|uniref:Uncharacterized protein n=1 Tax=Babesia gibsoni TaxID=33632 RepID=A0AAD8PFM9_BABGI|nr:hypothetical protein BgAZ_102710 [Babesia gibsoni]